jgi:hypothetical protein
MGRKASEMDLARVRAEGDEHQDGGVTRATAQHGKARESLQARAMLFAYGRDMVSYTVHETQNKPRADRIQP